MPLASDENVEVLVIKDASQGGSKALRWEAAASLGTAEAWIDWYNWLAGPFARLQAGAKFVVASLEHWRQALYTRNPALVSITKIKLTGSDLHEEGLGAMSVYIIKPDGTPGDNSTATRWGAAAKYAPRWRGRSRLISTRDKSPLCLKLATGHVRHKNAVVWTGMPLADALEILFANFPEQRGQARRRAG